MTPVILSLRQCRSQRDSDGDGRRRHRTEHGFLVLPSCRPLRVLVFFLTATDFATSVVRTAYPVDMSTFKIKFS